MESYDIPRNRRRSTSICPPSSGAVYKAASLASPFPPAPTEPPRCSVVYLRAVQSGGATLLSPFVASQDMLGKPDGDLNLGG